MERTNWDVQIKVCIFQVRWEKVLRARVRDADCESGVWFLTTPPVFPIRALTRLYVHKLDRFVLLWRDSDFGLWTQTVIRLRFCPLGRGQTFWRNLNTSPFKFVCRFRKLWRIWKTWTLNHQKVFGRVHDPTHEFLEPFSLDVWPTRFFSSESSAKKLLQQCWESRSAHHSKTCSDVLLFVPGS